MTDTPPSAQPTLAARVHERIGAGEVSSSRDAHETVLVPADRWLDAARALHALGFRRFIDLTAVDFPDDEQRFEVQLIVYSMDEKRWARLKARTAGSLSSVHSLYAGVHNYEREVFDLMGVVFDGHPRLLRIMLPEGWKGHPLRRDEAMPQEPVDFTVTRDLYKT